MTKEIKQLFNLELEQELLGSAIMAPVYAEPLLAVLKDEDFYFPEHNKIWQYLRKSYSINKGENQTTIKDYVNQIGGANYFNILISKARGMDIKESALEIKSLSQKRVIVEVAQNAINACVSGELVVNEIKEVLESGLGSIENQKEGKTELAGQAMLRVAKTSTAAHDGSNSIITLKSKFDVLDNLTGGFRPSELIVLAARPAMGKSALAANIAINAAKQGKVVLFFSFEMSNDQISARILANQTSVSLNKIKNGFASFNERKELEQKGEAFKQVPLIIQDTVGIDINSLRARIKKVAKNNELGLIVIDYLQLIKGTRRNNRVEEVSEITRSLKEMAIEFDVPILALSQLSRAVESREDKRPQLSDLRESGSIEQDANIVLFVYREEYYLDMAKPSDFNKLREWELRMSECKGVCDIIIAKQRDGATGSLSLKFEPEFSRFNNFF